MIFFFLYCFQGQVGCTAFYTVWIRPLQQVFSQVFNMHYCYPLFSIRQNAVRLILKKILFYFAYFSHSISFSLHSHILTMVFELNMSSFSFKFCISCCIDISIKIIWKSDFFPMPLVRIGNQKILLKIDNFFLYIQYKMYHLLALKMIIRSVLTWSVGYYGFLTACPLIFYQRSTQSNWMFLWFRY